jgi:ankyrin repeat protein
MFRSTFDTLPIEIILSVVDNLDPEDLRSLLYGIRWLPKHVTSRQMQIKDKMGNTILHVLAEKGEADLINPLLSKYSLNPNLRNRLGRTPLISAVMNGHQEIVELLLMKDGVDPVFTDRFGRTPLWWAVTHRQLGIVRVLLPRGHTSPRRRLAGDMLSWAVNHGRKETAEILLGLAIDRVNLNSMDEDGLTPLSHAVIEGHKDVIELLLAMDHINLNPVDSYGRTPLLWAAIYGDKEVVETFLVTDGIDLNPVDTDGRTPLIWAAVNGHKEVVETFLVTDGIDLNFVDTDGRTPLIWATIYGHKEVVEALLKNGINRDSRDHRGWTALRWAQEVIQMLLETDAIDQNDSFDSLYFTRSSIPLLQTGISGYGHEEVKAFVCLLIDGVDPGLDERRAATRTHREIAEILSH